jgi:plasmid stability protein
MGATTTRKTTAVTVRNLPIQVHKALKLRAQKNGVSTEAEIRTILKNAVSPAEQVNPADLLVAFGKKYGPLPYVRDRTPVEPIKFE